jgi:NNP family nitrate/nitrite transporter-like MFS transporter
MGMIGTAVSAFVTPRLVGAIGYLPTHLLLAAVMVAMAALVWFTMKESPAWSSSSQPLIPKVKGALKLAVTWEMAFLYAIVFGGFVAFSTYLPKYLTTIYPDQVDPVGAGRGRPCSPPPPSSRVRSVASSPTASDRKSSR